MASLSSRGGGSDIIKFKQDHDTTSSSEPSQENAGRKKRTFDIAFLTGQSESVDTTEKESNNNNHHHVVTQINSKRANSTSISPSFSGQTTSRSSCSPPLCSSSEPEWERQSPYNLSQNNNNNQHNQHDYSSDTSSMVDVELDVDVMTNGSLSDVEEESTPVIPTPQSRHLVIPSQFQPFHNNNKRQKKLSSSIHSSRVLLSLSQSHYNNHLNNHPKNNGGGGKCGKTYRKQGFTNTSSTLATTSSSNASGGGHHPPSELNGKTRGKSGKNAYPKNPPVKEEIRFESKRTIDINHSSDSLKIKENLQFSTLIPTNNSIQNQQQSHSAHHPHPHSHQNHHQHNHHQQSMQSLHPNPSDFNEFILPPHLATTFALFPHISSMSMTKFPGFLPIPMGHHHHHHHQQQQQQQSSPQDSSNHHQQLQGQSQQHSHPGGIHFSSSTKVEKSETSSFHHPSSSSHHHNLLSLSSSSSGSNHSPNNQKIRHFPDIYPGYPYPNLIIPSQFSPPGNGMSSSNQHSPNTATTLLPPSLTALTLPAQNVCAKCNIGFRMTSDLVYHMRSHHKRDTFDPLKKQREEKLKCNVCGESFRERHHLTRHMTAHLDRKEEIRQEEAAAAALLGNNHAVENSVAGISNNGSKLAA